MLGLFTQLAKLPDATKQLHVSSANNKCKGVDGTDTTNAACAVHTTKSACDGHAPAGTCFFDDRYHAGVLTDGGDDFVITTAGGEQDERVSNHKRASTNGTPETAATADSNASYDADYPGSPYQGNAKNPVN